MKPRREQVLLYNLVFLHPLRELLLHILVFTKAGRWPWSSWLLGHSGMPKDYRRSFPRLGLRKDIARFDQLVEVQRKMGTVHFHLVATQGGDERRVRERRGQHERGL